MGSIRFLSSLHIAPDTLLQITEQIVGCVCLRSVDQFVVRHLIKCAAAKQLFQCTALYTVDRIESIDTCSFGQFIIHQPSRCGEQFFVQEVDRFLLNIFRYVFYRFHVCLFHRNRIVVDTGNIGSHMPHVQAELSHHILIQADGLHITFIRFISPVHDFRHHAFQVFDAIRTCQHGIVSQILTLVAGIVSVEFRSERVTFVFAQLPDDPLIQVRYFGFRRFIFGHPAVAPLNRPFVVDTDTGEYSRT